ncbi:MAG: hypothetical protein KKB25_00255 [Nanoarchaeota archaeon]|nr:hypothetical protein [Nanoarchaeota archaeon]
MLAEEYRELSEISLKEVDRLKSLDSVILIGGWAAHFLANEKFREWKNIDYIGSKDIYFGIREKDLEEISEKLENLGYSPINFRFYKIFDRETKKEINESESRKRPMFQNFYLYVDLILDSPSKKDTVFFHDEIIKFALDNKLWTNREGMKILAPELLLLTKLNAIKDRNEEKRLKDMLDCMFVASFSNLDMDFFRQLKERFKISKDKIGMAKKAVESGLLDMELSGLRFDSSEIRGLKTAFISLLEL